MNIEEARELIQSPIWTYVRDRFLATGKFDVFPKGDLRRLTYLDEETQKEIASWRTALEHADEWRKVVDGSTVRNLKTTYPDTYPEVFRYQMYFAKFRGQIGDEAMKLLLKLKFPEAYQLCFS